MKHKNNDKIQTSKKQKKTLMQKDIIIWGAMILLTGCINPVLNWLNKTIINELSSEKYLLENLLYILIGYMILQLSCELLENIEGYLGTKIFYSISDKMITQMDDKISKIDLIKYESPEIYNLIKRVRDGVDKTSFAGFGSIIAIITSLVSLIGNVMILYTIRKYLPAIAFLASLPYAVIVILQGRDNYDYIKESNPLLRKEKYVNDILTSRNVIKEIKFFKLMDYLSIKAEMLRKNIFKLQKKLNTTLLKRDIITNCFRNLSLGICLFIICIETMQGKNTKVGDIVFLINTLQAITSTIVAMSTNINSISEFRYFKKDWNILMNLSEENAGKEKLNGYNIKFENVSFAYSDTTTNILSNISFEIKENEKIAIVGENGSGKSTLISLLLGLYKPSEGRIYVGNCNINNSLSEVRKIIACIFQNFNKYQLTVAENIGENPGKIDDSKLWMDKTNFMKNFSLNENTILGQLDDGGRELSGGQWQQIAILRALCKESAKILVMDEPTASIDPKTENSIYESLTKICQEKTLVLISHRLSAAALCDRIIVLGNGKIVEVGTHKELLQLKGKYYQMYNCQKDLYK